LSDTHTLDRLKNVDHRFNEMDSRLTKLTQATTKLGNHAVQQSGKFDALIAKLDGMTQVIGEKMTTMQSQTETRLEVHADKLVKLETQLEYAEKDLSGIGKRLAENDAYDKERTRMIEEAQRQLDAFSSRFEKHEEAAGKVREELAAVRTKLMIFGTAIVLLVPASIAVVELIVG